MDVQAPVLLGLMPLVAPPPVEGEGQGQGGFEQLLKQAEPAPDEEAAPETDDALVVDTAVFVPEFSPLKELARRVRGSGPRPVATGPAPTPQATEPRAEAPRDTAQLDVQPLDDVFRELLNPPPVEPDGTAEILAPAVKVELSEAAEVPLTDPMVDDTPVPMELGIDGVETPAEATARPVEAVRDVPELAAPTPDVVRVKVDGDLDIEVVREPNGIGVILDGAVEAVESLRDIGSDLRESLAQGGFELSRFEKRHRDGPADEDGADQGRDGDAGEPSNAPAEQPARRVRRGVYLDRMA